MQRLILIFACAALAGCATGVVPAGPDTFTVSAGGGWGMPSSPGRFRTEVYRRASEFCAARGLVMVPVSLDVQPMAFGRHTAGADLVFRALKPGDPEIKRPNIEGANSGQRPQEH